MEITGKIKAVLPVIDGVSQSGNKYKRQTIVIEYGDRYPKELALTLMNDKVDQFGQHLKADQQLKFHFDASSREYNGRYYTECMVWKVEPLSVPIAQPAPQPTIDPMKRPLWEIDNRFLNPTVKRPQPTAAPIIEAQPIAPATMPTDPGNDLPF